MLLLTLNMLTNVTDLNILIIKGRHPLTPAASAMEEYTYQENQVFTLLFHRIHQSPPLFPSNRLCFPVTNLRHYHQSLQHLVSFPQHHEQSLTINHVDMMESVNQTFALEMNRSVKKVSVLLIKRPVQKDHVMRSI